MPSSRNKLDHQSHTRKFYNLRSSKWSSSLLSFELSSIRETACQVGALGVHLQQLRRELATVKQEQKRAFTERDSVIAVHEGLLQVVKAALQCPICKTNIEQPFTARLSYRPEEFLPDNFRQHATPFTSAEIEILCDGDDPILPGRYYNCPTCRAFINDPPAEIPLLRDVAAKFTDQLNPDVSSANRRVLADADALWEIFFKK
ncbi:hypothetical protein CY34DRAFT_18445 [Suillus luteus UH-Slu-Lm8-n1]|uniref:Uncharacterized protein n=1 Tax=Suillus luteus UH-Slu-Lm8-n1 TaxID=930992 RepID=A0A0D0AGG5_9AGAM|nr:hypothetical protein CY34DRAFT_18445 [Suillus luteus UH-Slu-Lm8-n1]